MWNMIDLTHVIDPAKAQRKFTIETIGAETVNHNVVRMEDQWYIMTNITMVSHIGTHIEVPYHLLPDRFDLAAMPIDVFCGSAVILDFTSIQRREEISAERVKKEADRIGGITPGDIVLCNIGYADRYGETGYGDSPYFSEAAITWLSDSGMKMMGVDAGGIEIPASEEHVNHMALFQKNIPLIENIANLSKLTKTRFYLTAFPYPITGVEAFPIRVVAYEEA